MAVTVLCGKTAKTIQKQELDEITAELSGAAFATRPTEKVRTAVAAAAPKIFSAFIFSYPPLKISSGQEYEICLMSYY